MKLRVLLIVLLIAVPSVFGATVFGTVYDLSLNKVNGAVIEVQGATKQRSIAVNGVFEFDLPPGNYTIKADQFRDGDAIAEAQDSFQIIEEGRYRMDLILFPELEEPVSFIPESDLDIEPDIFERQEDPFFFVYRIIAVLAICAILYAFIRLRKHPGPLKKLATQAVKKTSAEKELEKFEKKEQLPETYTPLEEIIDFIKKQGGRTTQKEIRKAFPQSEAKISLMIHELEAKGKIQKFKKGRGNIISLK